MNLEVVKAHVRLWIAHYGLVSRQNRETCEEWVRIFEPFDPEFSRELQSLLDAGFNQ